MNLEHKEKQEVFDFYARSKGFLNWNHVINAYAFDVSEVDMNNAINCLGSFMVHVYNATDLIQRKALERASVNAKIKSFRRLNFMVLRRKFHDLSETRYTIDKESITNENNLIK